MFNKISKEQVNAILTQEFNYQMELALNGDSNANKNIKAIKVLRKMLNGIDDSRTFTLKPVPVKKQNPRNFDFFNLGSLGELIIKGYTTKAKNLVESKAKTFDMIDKDGTRWEVKTCINPSCKNTPIISDKKIRLINLKGVWDITDPQQYANKQGRLNANDTNGKYNQELSKKLGFEI